MGDYSPHVLELARETVAAHESRVSGLVLDATKPTTALGFLRYKAFLVYISNVYDNLPTDEIVRLGGRSYLVEPGPTCPAPRRSPSETSAQVALPDPSRSCCGSDRPCWPTRPALSPPSTTRSNSGAGSGSHPPGGAYVPLAGLDPYAIAPGVSGELFRPIVESNGDIRMHVNNGAAASFADTLPLLHPYGRLLNHDLFVTDATSTNRLPRAGQVRRFRRQLGQRPLLALVGSRKGFDVDYEPFATARAPTSSP